MLEDRSADAAALGFLLIAKIGSFFQQESEITALMDIKLRRQPGPHAMVHPGARNVVAVGDELARLIADDRRVGAVHANAGIVIQQQASDVAAVEEQQR